MEGNLPGQPSQDGLDEGCSPLPRMSMIREDSERSHKPLPPFHASLQRQGTDTSDSLNRMTRTDESISKVEVAALGAFALSRETSDAFTISEAPVQQSHGQGEPPADKDELGLGLTMPKDVIRKLSILHARERVSRRGDTLDQNLKQLRDFQLRTNPGNDWLQLPTTLAGLLFRKSFRAFLLTLVLFGVIRCSLWTLSTRRTDSSRIQVRFLAMDDAQSRKQLPSILGLGLTSHGCEVFGNMTSIVHASADASVTTHYSEEFSADGWYVKFGDVGGEDRVRFQVLGARDGEDFTQIGSSTTVVAGNLRQFFQDGEVTVHDLQRVESPGGVPTPWVLHTLLPTALFSLGSFLTLACAMMGKVHTGVIVFAVTEALVVAACAAGIALERDENWIVESACRVAAHLCMLVVVCLAQSVLIEFLILCGTFTLVAWLLLTLLAYRQPLLLALDPPLCALAFLAYGVWLALRRHRMFLALKLQIAVDSDAFAEDWAAVLREPQAAEMLEALSNDVRQARCSGMARQLNRRHTSAYLNPRSRSFSASFRDSIDVGVRGTVDPQKPVVSLDQLMLQARAMQPFMRAKAREWALESRGCFPIRLMSDKQKKFVSWSEMREDRAMMRRVQWATVKGAARAVQKCLLCYGSDPSRLLDVCRETIVFESIEDIRVCLTALLNDTDAKVARINNLMDPAHSARANAGYRAVIVNLRIVTASTLELSIDTHVCELQLVLSRFAQRQTEQDKESHRRFVDFRNMRLDTALQRLRRSLFASRSHQVQQNLSVASLRWHSTRNFITTSTRLPIAFPFRQRGSHHRSVGDVPIIRQRSMRVAAEEVDLEAGAGRGGAANESTDLPRGLARFGLASTGVDSDGSKKQSTADDVTPSAARMLRVQEMVKRGQSGTLLLAGAVGSEHAQRARSDGAVLQSVARKHKYRQSSAAGRGEDGALSPEAMIESSLFEREAELAGLSAPLADNEDVWGRVDSGDSELEARGINRAESTDTGLPRMQSEAENERRRRDLEKMRVLWKEIEEALKWLLKWSATRRGGPFDRRLRGLRREMDRVSVTNAFYTSTPLDTALGLRIIQWVVCLVGLIHMSYAVRVFVTQSQDLGVRGRHFSLVPTDWRFAANVTGEVYPMLRGCWRQPQSVVADEQGRWLNVSFAEEEKMDGWALVGARATEAHLALKAGGAVQTKVSGFGTAWAPVRDKSPWAPWEWHPQLHKTSGRLDMDFRVPWAVLLSDGAVAVAHGLGFLGVALCGVLNKEFFGYRVFASSHLLAALALALAAALLDCQDCMPRSQALWSALSALSALAALLILGLKNAFTVIQAWIMLCFGVARLVEHAHLPLWALHSAGCYLLLVAMASHMWVRRQLVLVWSRRLIQSDKERYDRIWNKLVDEPTSSVELHSLLELAESIEVCHEARHFNRVTAAPAAPLPKRRRLSAPDMLEDPRQAAPAIIGPEELQGAAVDGLATHRPGTSFAMELQRSRTGVQEPATDDDASRGRTAINSGAANSDMAVMMGTRSSVDGLFNSASVFGSNASSGSDGRWTRRLRNMFSKEDSLDPPQHTARHLPALAQIDLGSPVTSLDQLYAQALCLHPVLKHKVQGWADAADGMVAVSDPCSVGEYKFVRYRDVKDDPAMLARVRWAKLKGQSRAIQKLLRSYKGDVSRLLDVCRESIVFDDIAQLRQCLQTIADDPEVVMLRVKNRLDPRSGAESTAGYRDVALNLRVQTPLTKKLYLNAHVCEVQLILLQFAACKNTDGHKRYVEFRNARAE